MEMLSDAIVDGCKDKEVIGLNPCSYGNAF